MSTEILMPALSPTMTEGKLAKWLKKPGDEVKSGDVIAEIETDKATMEVEAVDEGKLLQILVEEGTEGVPVNTPIGDLGRRGRERGAGAGDHRAAGGAAGNHAGQRRPGARQQIRGRVKSRGRCRGEERGQAGGQKSRGRETDAAGGARQGLGRDQANHRARGAARRHGAGNAGRQGRVFCWAKRSRSIRVPTRSARACWRSSATAG